MSSRALVPRPSFRLILLVGVLLPRAPLDPPVEPVELNHIVVTVDQDTYDAIANSSYLRDVFANGEVQTVSAGPEESWTARYVVGENLYLEVFGPKGREGREPGYVGLAFSTRRMGDIDRVHERLTELAGERAHRILRTREVSSEVRNWFHAVSIDPPSFDRRLGAWIMESHPDHLGRLGLETDHLPARNEYLIARRRARGQPPAPSRLFRDVTRIDLALTEKEAADLTTLLRAAGWNSETEAGERIRLTGGDLELHIRIDAEPDRRLRALELALTRKPEIERRVEFGERSWLTVRPDGSARWVFDEGGEPPTTRDDTSVPSTNREVFWDTVPTLVPIRMILPPGFAAHEPHTLIVALHGYGSSAERFRRVGERLAAAGFLVALPEATNAFMTEGGELGFDWGLYHTGDSALDRRAFELLITEYMSNVMSEARERYAVERTYVLGFSQGAIAAVLSGIYLNEGLDGVITFGLGAYDPAWFQDPELAPALASGRHLSVLLIHGDEDERVPMAISRRARDHLAGEGYDVTLHHFHGGHTVPTDQLDFATEWLRGERR